MLSSNSAFVLEALAAGWLWALPWGTTHWHPQVQEGQYVPVSRATQLPSLSSGDELIIFLCILRQVVVQAGLEL